MGIEIISRTDTGNDKQYRHDPGMDKIKNDISHPYVVTKKDVRMKRMKDFFNKFQKAIGL